MQVVPLPTLVHHFVGQVQKRRDVACLFFNRDGQIVAKSWRETAGDVVRMAGALAALGVTKGDRVALASPNRYEWILADLAILGLGAVNMPTHNSLTGPQIAFQIVDSGAKVLVVAGDEQIAKLNEAEPLPADVRAVSFDATTKPLGGATVARLVDPAAAAPDDQAVAAWLDAAATNLSADDVATILYTSGTTGEPKGVILTHGNLATNAEAVVIDFHGSDTAADDEPVDRRLNLLPLSHIFARTCDLYTWLVAGNELALADAPQTVVADCEKFHPTLLNAVPYFYEKVMRMVVENGLADEPDIIPQALGGKVRHACSGGAPLQDHVAKFFVERGLLLTQGYGLTETSPVITMNSPKRFKHGTVGPPLPRVEVRIADDGEILTRGPHVMRGYWNRPEETAAALEGGWFHTGDLGELDADGFLKITGRKKELIVTTGGKKVVPSVVEALLAADPLVKQVVVVGDKRKFVAALVVCDDAQLAEAAKAAGLDVPASALRTDPRTAALVLERLQLRLAGLSRYEQIQKIALLDREFSIEREELTLTMKIRREQIAENFADAIDRMYAAERCV